MSLFKDINYYLSCGRFTSTLVFLCLFVLEFKARTDNRANG